MLTKIYIKKTQMIVYWNSGRIRHIDYKGGKFEPLETTVSVH